MFNVQGSEVIIILLLALIVLGPEKLPDAIRRFTTFYSEAKKMSTGFQTELRNALDEPMRELQATADLVRKQADLTSLMSTTAEQPPSPPPVTDGATAEDPAPHDAPGPWTPPGPGAEPAPPPDGSGPERWSAPTADTVADPAAAPSVPAAPDADPSNPAPDAPKE